MAASSRAKRNGVWRKQAFRTTAEYDRAISARLAQVGGAQTRCPRVLDIRAPKLHVAALRREPASAGGALRIARTRESRARSNCTARNFRTTTWSIWMPAWQLVSEFSRSGGGDHQAHQSGRLRGAVVARGSVPEGARMRPGLGVRRRDRVQSRSGRRDGAAKWRSFSWKPIAAPAYSPAALEILQAKKNMRLVQVRRRCRSAGRQVASPAGISRRRPIRAAFDRATLRSQDAPRAHGRGMGGARIRLESRQARQVERHRLCARGPDRGRGRGADEPRRFGQDRRHESACCRSRERWWPRTPSSRFPMAWKRRRKAARRLSSSPADRSKTPK